MFFCSWNTKKANMPHRLLIQLIFHIFTRQIPFPKIFFEPKYSFFKNSEKFQKLQKIRKMDEISTKSDILSPMLPIRQIYSYNSKVCLILGFMLNLTVIWLVRYRTPKEMKVYSKIVFQTCFVDLILLVSSELVQPVSKKRTTFSL